MIGTLVILAKEPRPGFSKTRLTPPLTPDEAAELADAALFDTVTACLGAPAARHVLCIDGSPPRWLPSEVEVIPQRPGAFGDRLDGAFRDVSGPTFLIAMDTPQVTPAQLSYALSLLLQGEHPTVLGLTPDGGYWGIGMREQIEGAFLGVPMSSPETGKLQSERLAALGAGAALLPELQDVDCFGDAVDVADIAPSLRFSSLMRDIISRPSFLARTA